jgi:hypothetical protein
MSIQCRGCQEQLRFVSNVRAHYEDPQAKPECLSINAGMQEVWDDFDHYRSGGRSLNVATLVAKNPNTHPSVLEGLAGVEPNDVLQNKLALDLLDITEPDAASRIRMRCYSTLIENSFNPSWFHNPDCVSNALIRWAGHCISTTSSRGWGTVQRVGIEERLIRFDPALQPSQLDYVQRVVQVNRQYGMSICVPITYSRDGILGATEQACFGDWHIRKEQYELLVAYLKEGGNGDGFGWNDKVPMTPAEWQRQIQAQWTYPITSNNEWSTPCDR